MNCGNIDDNDDDGDDVMDRHVGGNGGIVSKKVFVQVDKPKDGSSKYKLEALISYVHDTDNKNRDDNGRCNLLWDIGVVIAHPHPMLGGNYQNNVVLGVSSYLTHHLHIPTLCYNYRGVGKSTGRGSWRGGSERDDTLEVIEYMLGDKSPLPHKPKQIIMIGYSYGAVIGGSICSSKEEIIAFVSISYPFGPLTLMLLGYLLEPTQQLTKPKLMIQGDQDNFTGISKFNSRVNEMKEPVQSIIFKNVDHFYGGYEKSLAKRISNWILSILDIPSPPPSSSSSSIITTS